MNKLSIIGLLLLLVLSSCRDDFDETTTVTDYPDPPVIQSYQPEVQEITASVRGHVFDENGEAVEGASVSYEGGNTSTNEYGLFFITDAVMNAKGTVIQVEKDGYFKGNRRFFPIADKESRIRIQLIPKSFDQSFSAESGGEVTFGPEGQITFQPNAIANADGSPYNGEVRVASYWLDPSAISTMDEMPGSLNGVSLQNQEVALATYGMVAVELEDPSGNSLNILKGHTAEMRMPVPGSLLNNAPETIPLWSFYEPYGLWAEEGEAALVGNAYVGEVSHFSFWNCDYPFDLVEFHARFVDADDDPIANSTVVLSINGGGGLSVAASVTDGDGNVSGKVPANEEMTMSLYNLCGEIIYEEVIGPFSTDVSLGDITVSGSGLNNINLSGTVVNCDSEPVNQAWVLISYDNITVVEYITGGVFDVDVVVCNSTSEIVVIGIDIDSLAQSDTIIISPSDTDFGEIEACDVELQNYIQITSGGQTAVYPTSDSVSFFPTYTGMEAWGSGSSGQFYVSVNFNGGTAGSYGNNNYAFISDQGRGWEFRQGVFETFEVTEYGNVGEVVKGYFSGTLQNSIDPQNPVMETVEGEFSVIRQ